MPIHTVESRRLYRQIADQLSQLITSGEFAPGQRLPSERELARQLGVSRPSVREALISLEIEGKVGVRVGAGIFVAAARGVPISPPCDEEQGPFELLRARWLIEGEVATVAARERTPRDLELIRASLEEMELCQRLNQSAETADREFHLRVAMATHNSALVAVIHDLWDRGRGAIWKRMELHFQTPALRAAAIRDHRAIVEALEAGEARAARAAMRRHLERVDREFTRGWERMKERAEEPARLAAAEPAALRRPRVSSRGGR
jgi:GntR family transcriptional repressor for pyruvate dehydrogenase complex